MLPPEDDTADRWLARTGLPLSEDEARAVAALLAHSEAGKRVERVERWRDLAPVLARLEHDPTWWNFEEDLRESLWQIAAERMGENALYTHLKRIEASAAGPAASAGARATPDPHDRAFARAAAEAIVLACHQNELGLLAGVGSDHYFRRKHALVSAGRWPLGAAQDAFLIL